MPLSGVYRLKMNRKISKLVKEGKPQKQAVAISFSMSRKGRKKYK